MNDHRAHSDQTLPNPSLPMAVGAMLLAWIVLFIHDILTGDWSGSPAEYGIGRLLLPLLGFVPAAFRMLQPEKEQQQLPFTIFKRLTFTALIMTGSVLILGILPYAYADTGAPSGFWSMIIGRFIALIMMMGLPLLCEGLVRLYHYRNRSAAARLPRLFTYGLLLALVIGEFLPVTDPEDGSAGLHSIARALAGIISLFGLVLSTKGGWIVNLRKRQKLGLLGLAFIGMGIAGMLIHIASEGDASYLLLSIGPGFGALMLSIGMTLLLTCMVFFVSALFALPTADAIDRRNTEVSSLANFARLLTQSLDRNHLIDTAITIACDAMAGNGAWIELKQGESYAIHLGSNPKVPSHIVDTIVNARTARDLTLAQATRYYRRVEVVDNVTGATWNTKGSAQSIRSVAAVPLLVGGEHCGTLYVAKDRADGFDREETVVLNALADQIAMAMEHSSVIQKSIERERFEQEMLIAQDLQRRLLPTVMPSSPFYELYAESLPASLVGGDYYDVVAFSDQTLGILIADVSGKGASAALYMGMIKGIIQALSGRCANPKELLAQANVALYGSIDQRWFATMTCAQIIDEKRTLRIARAGHCPTLLLRDGAGYYTRPKGLGLAIAKPALFDNNLEIEEISFSSGDYVVFYSDGLPEARSREGEEYGYDRLLRSASDAAVAGMNAHAMRDAIFREIDTFSEGEPQGDDSTLVILRWC